MENRDHLEIAYKSMELFQNDGKLNEDEFNQLMDIALRDGVVTEDEKRVLNDILDRLHDDEITRSFEARIKQVREKYGI